MRRTTTVLAAVLTLAATLGVATNLTRATPPGESPSETDAPARPSVEEARQQAKLLHETVHATLQVVHHEYYREDEGLVLPAATLKRMFREVAKSRNVQLRWLSVNAEAMNIEHLPESPFEKEAAAALSAGKVSHEQVADGVYRHVGQITLTSDCLKCHLPNRKSTEDRTAGLLITIPIAGK